MIISSAPKCPNCAAWRGSARVVSIAVPAVVLGVVAIIGAITWQSMLMSHKRMAEHRELILMQRAQQQ
jgi:hypothetical protein